MIANPSSSANCLLCVEDYSRQNTAEQMRITANGNIYVRSSASQPTWLAVWSRGSVNVNPYVFTSLAAFKATTGQEARGREYIDASAVGSTGVVSSSIRAAQSDIALALPDDVAKALGRATGSKQLGRWI